MSRRPTQRPGLPPRPGSTGPSAFGRGNAVWIGLIGVVLLASVAIIGSAMWGLSKAVPTDKQSFCPKRGPAGLTVILIDATDSMSLVQRTAITNRLKSVVLDLPSYEQIAVYPITESSRLMQPVETLCRPQRPEEVSEATGNPDMAQAMFEQRFLPKIDALMRSAIDLPPSQTSPLMESIQAVNVAAFQKLEADQPGRPLRKQLVVVSDMLENGRGGSHYQGVPDFSAYRTSLAYRQLRSDMSEVQVRIFYVGRADGAEVQGHPHIEFWERWFADQGATMENVTWIEG